MAIDPLDNWKTQAEAAAILKCSQKTIGRMATQKKIQRVLRRVPGRTPMPVFNPGAWNKDEKHMKRENFNHGFTQSAWIAARLSIKAA